VPKNPERSSYFPAIEERYGQPMSYWFEQMAERSEQNYNEQMAYLREEHGFTRTHANALVLYFRGSTSSRRYNTLEEYLAVLDDDQQRTLRTIFTELSAAFPDAEVVIAWNQPMLKYDGKYLFGAGAQKHHILIAPFDTEIIETMRPRLAGYHLNKKTIRVPNDWEVDAALLTDMVKAQLAT